MQRKRDILPHTANLTGAVAAVYIVSGTILQLLAGVVVRSFHAQATLDNPIGVPESVRAALHILIGALSLLAAVRFARSFGRSMLPKRFSFTDPRDRRLWLFLPVFLSIGLLGSVVSSLLQSFLQKHTYYTPPQMSVLPESGLATAFCFISMCVVPAIFEELLVRGCLQNLFRRWGIWFSIAVSSAVFTLLHADVAQMPTIFCLSVFLGLCAYVTDSLFPGMVLHFANNALSFLFLYIQQRMDGRTAIGVTVYLLAAFFFGAALCIWQIAAMNLMRTLRPIPRAANPKNRAHRVRRMLRSPLFVGMMLYLLVRAVWPLVVE